MSDPFQIKTQATVYSVRTLVDKGLRVTLDMPEGSIEAAALLMGCQQHGVVLDVTATEQAHADATVTNYLIDIGADSDDSNHT